MGKTIAITSMYANQLHPRHVECLELSKALADKHWVVVSSTASVEIRDKKHPKHVGHRIIEKNESRYEPQRHLHCLAKMHEEPLVTIEVQSGAYTGEDDIVRYEDDYARVEMKD
jgi:mannose-6-phosphate isomerase-like protein (cupin superfamily)